MRTVVFYSYKGGTGRTLTLANIAWFAAGIGKRVVAIDMDLEAPGLTYKLLRGDQAGLRNRGLVGCLLDTVHGAEVPVDLGEYLIDVALDPGEITAPDAGGWLKLMPAGVVPSPNYFGDLRRLALDARTADGTATELLRALTDRLQQDFDPDLLLIDARTGITNTNTLVLSELADHVFAFSLDLPEQLDGVRMVLRSLAPLTRDPDRPVHLHGVISRVPVEDDHRRAGWVETVIDRERSDRIERFLTEPSAATGYSIDSIGLFCLHHEPSFLEREHLLMEELSGTDVSNSPLAWDYSRLAAVVIDDAAAVGRAVAHLTRNNDPPSWSVAAMLVGDPNLRAQPNAGTASHEVPAQPGEPSLRDRIDATRATARLDPLARARLATLLLELAAAERAIGNRVEAVAPTEEAVTIYRELAAAHPAFLNGLASSLNNLGNRYAEIGRTDESAAARAGAEQILPTT